MFLALLEYLADQDLKPRRILILFSLLPMILGGLTLIAGMAERAILFWIGILLLASFLLDISRVAFKFRAFLVPMVTCIIMITINVLFFLD